MAAEAAEPSRLLLSLNAQGTSLLVKVGDAHRLLEHCRAGTQQKWMSQQLLQSYLTRAVQWLIGTFLSKGCEEARQTPCCWDLLADLLLAGGWQTGGVTVSPNLAVPLAAAAQIKEGGLGLSLERAISELSKISWRPSLEHAAGLLVAVLDASHDVQRGPEWLGASLLCVQLLHAIASEHPSPRKAFTCISNKPLLQMLLTTGFVEVTQSNIQCSKQKMVAHACRGILSSILLSPSNTIRIGESCSAVQDKSSFQDKDTLNRRQMSYHSLFLRNMMVWVQEGHECAGSVLQSTPWMLEKYCIALQKQRILERDWQNGQPLSTPVAREATPRAHPRLEFEFFRFMASLHLQSLQSRANSQTVQEAAPGRSSGKKRKTAGHSGDGGPSLQTKAGNSAALLLAAVGRHGVYSPIEDKLGKELEFLQEFATQTISQIEGHVENAADSNCASNTLSSTAAFCSALAKLEHRAIQPHLQVVWHMLWELGLSKDTGSSEAAVGASVATEAAISIIETYAELRQLTWILQSMSMSLDRESSDAVIGDKAFMSALRHAVHNLHAGLGAPLVRWVAQDSQYPEDGIARESFEKRASRSRRIIHIICLQTVQVDITTAIPISKAVAKLLDNSLSYAVIKEVCTDAPPKEAGIVLELYCAALSLHRACKSVHPDVPQLSGRKQHNLGDKGGFFSAAFAASGTSSKERQLHELAHLWNGNAVPVDTTLSLCQAAVHRFQVCYTKYCHGPIGTTVISSAYHLKFGNMDAQVAHELFIHHQYSCPVFTSVSPSSKAEYCESNLVTDESLCAELVGLSSLLAQVLISSSADNGMGATQNSASRLSVGDCVKAQSSAVSTLVLGAPMFGMWLQWVKEPLLQDVMRSIVRHFAALDYGHRRLLDWIENSKSERVHAQLPEAVYALLVEGARDALQPWIGNPMGKDRVGKKMPKHIGSTADEQRLAVLLDEFNCLSSTTDQLDMSPPSMSMISTQATIAGFSETSQKHCSMDFDATSQGGIGNLAFAAMTVEHASPAFFQGTVAARGVKLLLHSETCLHSAISQATASAGGPQQEYQYLIALTRGMCRCRAALQICIEATLCRKSSVTGLGKLMKWLWRSAESLAALAVHTGNSPILRNIECFVSMTRKTSVMPLHHILKDGGKDATKLLSPSYLGRDLSSVLFYLMGNQDTSGSGSEYEGSTALGAAQDLLQTAMLKATMDACAARPFMTAPTQGMPSTLMCSPRGKTIATADFDALDSGTAPSCSALAQLAVNVLPTVIKRAVNVLESGAAAGQPERGSWVALNVMALATGAAAAGLQHLGLPGLQVDLAGISPACICMKVGRPRVSVLHWMIMCTCVMCVILTHKHCYRPGETA